MPNYTFLARSIMYYIILLDIMDMIKMSTYNYYYHTWMPCMLTGIINESNKNIENNDFSTKLPLFAV